MDRAALDAYDKTVRSEVGRLHPSGSVDVDALTAAGFEAVWQALTSHDPDQAPVAAWVRWRVRRAVVDELRRQTRWNHSLHRSAAPATVPFPDRFDPTGPATAVDELIEAVARRQVVARILPLFSWLDPRTRLITTLYYFGGCTQLRIGEAFGITEGMVSRILTAGTHDLRRFVTGRVEAA